MNVAARTIASPRYIPRDTTKIEQIAFPSPAPSYVLVFLLIAVMSMLSFVYVTDLNRRLFVECQEMHKNYANLQIEENKLLLQQGLSSPHTKIQELAEQRLNMKIPINQDIVVVSA
jgi:cell division protein FtsL